MLCASVNKMIMLLITESCFAVTTVIEWCAFRHAQPHAQISKFLSIIQKLQFVTKHLITTTVALVAVFIILVLMKNVSPFYYNGHSFAVPVIPCTIGSCCCSSRLDACCRVLAIVGKITIIIVASRHCISVEWIATGTATNVTTFQYKERVDGNGNKKSEPCYNKIRPNKLHSAVPVYSDNHGTIVLLTT